MLFALLVLNSTVADRSLVFDVASFTVLASILAHGPTDTLGANGARVAWPSQAALMRTTYARA